MALPSTGQISFSQVYNEINGNFNVPANYKLSQLAESAETAGCTIGGNPVNFSAPYSMNAFLGMDCGQQPAFTLGITGDSFTINFYPDTTLPNPNCTIFWGDGSSTVVSSVSTQQDYSHTYASNTTHEIKVIGSNLNGLNIGYTNATNRAKALDIKEWGNCKFHGQTGQFGDCINLVVTAQDLPNLDSNSTFGALFNNCDSLNINRLNEWNMGVITDRSIGTMFFNATNWNQDVSGWDVTGLTGNHTLAFAGTSLSTENYDKLLESWSAQAVNSGVEIGFGSSTCYNNKTARDLLVSKGWTINDGGICPISAPSNVTATQSSVNEDVTVTWTDNSDNEDGFIIHRTFDPDDPNISSSRTQVGTVGANVTSFVDTDNKSNNGTYRYDVQASRTDAPNSSLAYSNYLDIETEPNAPSGVFATQLSGDIRITWNDEATTENGYAIEFMEGIGSWTLLDNNLIFNTEQYDHNYSFTNGQTYKYRVWCYNSRGGSTKVESNSVTYDDGGFG